MGSATITNITNMADEKKKSIKCLIKNIFGKKKDKFDVKDNSKKEIKDTKETNAKDDTQKECRPQINTVDAILENFKKLELEKKKEEEDNELSNFTFKPAADELDNFTTKIVEEERRTERSDSNLSEDSGFGEKDIDDRHDDVIKEEDETRDDVIKEREVNADVEVTEKNTEVTNADEEVIDALESLQIDGKKKKKTQQVPLSRTPLRNKAGDLVQVSHPYKLPQVDNCNEINQVNRRSFSGGHVVVAKTIFQEPNSIAPQDPTVELQTFSNDLVKRGVEENVLPFDLDLIMEYIDEEAAPNTSDYLEEFIKDPITQQQIETISPIVDNMENVNPIEELENANHLNYDRIENLDSLIGFEEDKLYTTIFPTPPSADLAHSPRNEKFYSNFLTPPRSETAPSPISDSASFYPTNSEYTLSPHSDCEKYQEIPQYFEEYPSFISEVEDLDKSDKEVKERERNTSTSSMSMKNFKDLQKELAGSFSKKECCQISRKPCKDIFQGHLKKLKAEERRGLCLKVASMDFTSAYGVLHQVLIAISRGTPDEDLHMALFALVCERVLADKPQLFAEEFGLGVLKAAVMRCPQYPQLTRYVVLCIRVAIKLDPSLVEGKDSLFKEVDAQGDTLVTACARAGDGYAPALAELVRRERGEGGRGGGGEGGREGGRDLPLFALQHTNTEGYTALHVACREHGRNSPCSHVVHVLLEHGGADIWKGDVKGGDTAVHMAVNSASCELPLVLMLFRHLDRKLWKKLAHVPNRSSVTPLDYARCAAKSTTRQNYPTEVLEFLKKCR